MRQLPALKVCLLRFCALTVACRAYPMYDPAGRKAWSLEESREKGLYAAAVAIAWGSQVGCGDSFTLRGAFNGGTG